MRHVPLIYRLCREGGNFLSDRKTEVRIINGVCEVSYDHIFGQVCSLSEPGHFIPKHPNSLGGSLSFDPQ
jgi:hypothetical protein